MIRPLLLAFVGLGAAAIAAAGPVAPPFEQHYAPGENLEAIDVALIGEAGHALDMAAYVLTEVIRALQQAATRGVRVRIYRQHEERRPPSEAAAALAEFERTGGEIRFKPADAPLMHLKTYCVDGRALRFGAANFSRSGLTAQDNDLEIARGPGVCMAFEADFERMWSRK